MSASDGGILVVCAANVCRSPMTEFALRRSFAQQPGFDKIATASAGVRVTGGRLACPDVVEFRAEPEWALMASQHVSRLLDPGMVRSAALVVTATREQRAAVVAATPECRGSVFTLQEALWLGQGYERGTGTPASRAVTAFREHIHGLRGLRPLPEPRRHRLWRRRTTDPLDIADGHGGRSRPHHQAMRAALAGGNELAALIAGRGR